MKYTGLILAGVAVGACFAYIAIMIGSPPVAGFLVGVVVTMLFGSRWV